MLGFVGSSTKGTNPSSGTLSIEALDIKRTSTNASITVYLRNVGGVPISLLSPTVYFEFPDGTQLTATVIAGPPDFATSMNPGQTTSGNYLVTSSNVNAGQVYTVKVVGDDGTSAVLSAKAHS